MSKKVYEESNIQAIATAIRNKTGTENTYTTSEMPSGVNEVYESGKQKQYDEFWDASRKSFTGRYLQKYAFAGCNWNDTTFNPKYSLSFRSLQNVFSECAISNLAEILERNGVTFDFSSSLISPFSADMFAYSSTIVHMPELNFSKVTAMGSSFSYCKKLVTIDKIILPSSGATTFSGNNGAPFENCTNLANITFEGVIGKSISFSSCPLTVDSMKSIITHLKDYSGTTSEFTYKVTFSGACKETLAAEGNTSPNGNTWIEYINDLCWNC